MTASPSNIEIEGRTNFASGELLPDSDAVYASPTVALPHSIAEKVQELDAEEGYRSANNGPYWSSLAQQPPGQVTQLGPLGDVSTSTPTFSWDPEASATDYMLVIYSYSTDEIVFSVDLPFSVCNATECTYTPSGFSLGSGDFTWLIRASNGAGDGPWSNYLAPTAADDSYSTDEEIALVVNVASGVLDNDSDPNLDPLQANLVDDVGNGTLSLNIDGSFTYTPTTGFVGQDTFTYQANDGTSNSNIATVTITVNNLNDGPSAGNDAYETAPDTALVVNAANGVLENDSDPDLDPLQANLAGDVGNGTLSLNIDGSFTYTPTTSFVGQDSFTYRASDGITNSNIATATISVIVPPQAIDDDYITDEDVTLVVAVGTGLLANDVDNNPPTDLTASLLTTPTHGTLTSFSTDGAFTYVPHLDFSGSDSFTYYAVDGVSGATDQATVNLTLAPINDAPIADDETYETAPDTTLVVNVASGVLDNDSDPDLDLLQANLVDDVSNGNLSLNLDGSLTYTPTTGFVGQDSFTYRATDGITNSNMATVTITVTVSLQAVDDDYITDEDMALVVAVGTGLLANDVDNNPPTDLIVSLLTTPTHGTLTNFGTDGAFTYVPDPDFSGSDSFTYEAVDGVSSATDQASVDLTVNPVNDSPLANDDAYETAPDTVMEVNAASGILDNDNDPEQDSLQANLVDDVDNGNLTLNLDGSFTYTPNNGFVGQDSFTYQASDSITNSNTALVTLIMTGTNEAPVAVEDIYNIVPDAQLTMNATKGILANDSDPNLNPLQAILVDDVSNGNLTVNADGSFTYTPNSNFEGVDTFTYQANDAVLNSNVVTVRILIGFPTWDHLSSANGDIEVPNGGSEQTSSLVLDIDLDGINDFVIAERTQAPSVVWYQRNSDGWLRHIVDDTSLPVLLGEALHDIDDDGDLDIVFAADGQGPQIWWWENPYPNFAPLVPWTRREIKNSGKTKHHDQIFGDVDNDGNVELVSWNQQVGADLLVINIPADPQNFVGEWPRASIASGANSFEGLAIADIDLDSKLDIVGAGRWYKHITGTGPADWQFQEFVIESDLNLKFARMAAGQLISGGRPEVVIAYGDASGPLKWYQWNGSTWDDQTLIANFVNGHSLTIADINEDGHLDIFNAEMGNPGDGVNADSIIFYGDGAGNFQSQTVSVGIANHESRVADLDGDGDLDILTKPFKFGVPRLDIFLNQGTRVALNQWQRHEIDPNVPYRPIVMIFNEDFNGDGFTDIGSGGSWYEHPGTLGGNWTEHSFGTQLNLTVVYDFDGDGDVDVLGTQGVGTSSDFVWAQNDGNGVFTTFFNVDSGPDPSEFPGERAFPQGAVIGQFGPNGTGPLEVVLQWENNVGGTQFITVPGNPTVAQWTIRTVSGTSQGEEVRAADLDLDGDQDLYLGTQWLRNDGANWTTFNVYPNLGTPDRNRVGDVNGDGLLDAVVTFGLHNPPGRIAWYEQPASSPEDTWTEHIIDDGTIGFPQTLDLVDMDFDGDLDVITGEHHWNQSPSTLSAFIFENVDGLGTSWTRHTVYTGDEQHNGTQAFDFDGDGDLDISSHGWVNDKVVLYENLAIGTTTNLSPVAANDSYATGQNITLTVDAANGVLANDTDPDLDPLQAILVDNGSNGMLNLNSDGSFDYTPNNGYAGQDTFTYRANDGDLNSNLATVTISVVDPNVDTLVLLPLDEGSGTVAGDMSGQGNNGTLLNGAGYEASTGDGSPYAMRFDGANDYIELGSIDANGTGLTLAAWFNADSFPGTARDPRIISKSSSTSANDHVFMLSTVRVGSDTRLRGRVRVGGTTTTLVANSGNLSVNQWYHAAMTYDGSTLRLYLDGIEVGSKPLSGGVDIDSSVPIAVGGQPTGAGGRYFDGLLDDIRILQRAMSQAELQAIANGN
ncbi:MAG: Ig-like domain-containing protein [Chloroflexota bacterium]